MSPKTTKEDCTSEKYCRGKLFMCKIYKKITVLLFLILPSKITNIFVNLSILAAIYKIRNLSFSIYTIDIERIQSLLKIVIKEEILLLPNYSVHVFWTEDFFNTKTLISGKEYTLRQIISNCELFSKNLKLVTDMFINNLPSTLKMKLGIKNAEKRLELEDNLIKMLSSKAFA